VVLDKSKYKDKLNTSLESRVYEPLPKDPTTKVERKVQKLLSHHRTALLADLKQLTPYHSRPPHLYGLPKIQKLYIPLRLMSSVGSPCCALAGFLLKMITESSCRKIGILHREFRLLHTVQVCQPSSSRYPH
jgi:hypothetical protein